MNNTEFDCFALLPAQSGFWALTLLTETKNEPIGLDRNVIIAWAFEVGFTTPVPVTLEGAVRENYAVELPGGQVYLPGNGEEFDTPQEWLAECKEKWEAQQRYEAFMAANGVDVTSKHSLTPSSSASPHPAVQAALAAARNAAAARIVAEQARNAGKVTP